MANPKTTRINWRWILIPLGMLLVMITSSLGLVGTSAGRTWLAETALPWAGQQAGYQVHIEQVHSPNLGQWTIQQVQIHHQKQLLLDAHQLEVVWTPEALSDHKIAIQRIGFEQLLLNANHPLFKSKNQATRPTETNRNSVLPWSIQLDELNLNQLQIQHNSLPEQQSYAVRGQLKLQQAQPFSLDLDVKTLSGVPMTLSVKSTASSTEQAQITAHFEEQAGGLIGTLIRQSPGQNLALQLQATLTQEPAGIHAQLDTLQSEYQGHKLALVGDASFQPSTRSGDWNLQLTTDQRKHQIQGQLREQNLDMQIQLDRAPLSLVSAWTPEALSGYASADLRIQGPVASPKAQGNIELVSAWKNQPVEVQAVGSASADLVNIESAQVTSESNHLNLAGKIDLKQQQLDLQAETEAIQMAFIRRWLPDVPADVNGELQGQVHLQGPWNTPSAEGQMQFNGDYRAIPVKLHAQGRGSQNQIHLERLSLETIEQGQLNITGDYKAGDMDFHVAARALPNKLLNELGWPIRAGQMQADLTLKGTLKRPLIAGDIHLNTSWNTLNEEQEPIQIPMSMHANAQTASNELKLNLQLKQSDESVGHLNVAIPMARYLSLEDGAQLPLLGHLDADLDLAHVNLFLDPDMHLIKGHLKAKAHLDGDLDQPQIQGQASVENGHYENFLTGTLLTDAKIDLALKQDQITIKQAKAHDGENGTLQLEGSIDWSTSNAQSIQLALIADKAQILRRHDLEGAASGRLNLTGNAKVMSLKGQLDLTPFTLYLDNLQTSSIPEIEVTEIHAEPDEQPAPKQATANLLPTIQLDLTLNAEQQAYLRGRGLLAELSGQVRIGGTTQNPSYAGQFQTLRGQYEILGKKFTLQNGRARFEGDQVLLFIPGVHRTKDAEIKAELSGTLDDLALKLSSDPVMPEDEIIAHLLFGKSARNISPLQAIQLASALNTLRTGGRSLFNPVESTRNLLGVDTLSIDNSETADGDGVTVGVGKYVSEKVYVEIEKGSLDSQPWKGSVEVEVTPNLSVESTTGGNSGLGGIELQWKHDY